MNPTIPTPRLPAPDHRPASSVLRLPATCHPPPATQLSFTFRFTNSSQFHTFAPYHLHSSAPSACVALAKQASRPSRELSVHRPPTTDYRPPSSGLRPFPPVHGLPTFPPSHLLTLRTSRRAAFSLTEVVIALGIFAVSMVGVLALFPVASTTGRESSEETQAAIIAQTVLSDLRSSAANLGRTNAWLVSGKNTFVDLIRNIRLTEATNVAIAYDIKRRDRADSAGGDPLIGPPLALKALQSVSTTEYNNGVSNIPNVTYLSLLTIQPVAQLPGVAQATLEVSTPATARLTNRRVFYFSTLVHGP